MGNKIKILEKDGGLLKRIRNLNNLSINMELEIGNALLDFFNKELMFNVYIDGKKS
jgi:hypothetical protein